MLRAIVSWLAPAPILVAMLLAGCSNEPATPSLDGSAPMATETPLHTPTTTSSLFAIPSVTPTPASPDRAALVALYDATGGANWANNRNWLSDRPLGEWYGVTTDGDGRVTGLNLGFNQLSGAIPTQLGNLSNLKTLWLHDNRLSGAIPAELGSLANLEGLGLSLNELSGPVPAELGSLSNLQVLYLYGNSTLSEPLPGSLTSLTSLITLRLTGLCAPTEDGFQTWLQGIENKAGVVNCVRPDRAALVALYNATDGANWANNRNWLSDRPLNEWYGVSTDGGGRVTGLALEHNELSGPLPAELGSLSNLQVLYLYGNSTLSGPLPGSLTGLTSLTTLWLDGTALCAPTGTEFQTWLQGVKNKSGVVNCVRSGR